MTEKRIANYELHKAAMDAKLANIKQSNRQQREGGDVDMSVPEGRAAAVTTPEPPVQKVEAAPVETIPIETPPIETAAQLDW